MKLGVEDMFQLWKISQQLALIRLEVLIRLTIRRSITHDNVVQFVANAYKYNMKAELNQCLQIIHQNASVMQEHLAPYPELTAEVLAASMLVSQEELIIPTPSLGEDFKNAITTNCDVVLMIKDSHGNTKAIKTHKAVICKGSEYFKAYLDFRSKEKEQFVI